MGSRVSKPSPTCLPKSPVNEIDYYVQEIGIQYIRPLDDNHKMWEIKLPDGWGIYHDKEVYDYICYYICGNNGKVFAEIQGQNDEDEEYYNIFKPRKGNHFLEMSKLEYKNGWYVDKS